MSESTAAREAFTIANEIKASMNDLLEALYKLGEDKSYTTIQRHMIIKQVCNFFSGEAKELEEYADTYLEEKVEHVTKATDIDGFHIHAIDDDGGESDDVLYISGMTYNYIESRSVEILNKDTKSWGQLLNLMVEVGLAGAVQQRLTLSKLDNEDTLKKLQGLVNVKTEGKWAIKAPPKTKAKR